MKTIGKKMMMYQFWTVMTRSEDSIEPAKRSRATMQEPYEATTPEEFYQLGVERNWTLPVQVLETYQRRLKSMQFRTGTIGAWLKDMLR